MDIFKAVAVSAMVLSIVNIFIILYKRERE